MQIPEEFKRLSQCFWQGSDEEAKDENDWIARALKLNNQKEQAVIKKFLTDLLASGANNGELVRVWNGGWSGYGVHEDQVRDFFQKIRDMIK